MIPDWPPTFTVSPITLPGTIATNATDPVGFSASATMNITVLSVPPTTSSLVLQGSDLLLSWSGGVAPYQVQMATNLASPFWQPLGLPVSANS